FSSQLTADTPMASGTARPRANARSRITPSKTEPIPAVTPSNTTSAGVHTGHAATVNGIPRRNAPQAALGRLARKPNDGSGIRSHPPPIRPTTINSGPRNSPHPLPIIFATHFPPKPAVSPRTTWVRIMPSMNIAPKNSAWLLSRPLVTYARANPPRQGPPAPALDEVRPHPLSARPASLEQRVTDLRY